jgi:hypothetical protein
VRGEGWGVVSEGLGGGMIGRCGGVDRDYAGVAPASAPASGRVGGELAHVKARQLRHAGRRGGRFGWRNWIVHCALCIVYCALWIVHCA